MKDRDRKKAKIIKVKGPIQRLISPAEFPKALGAEETNIKINTKQDPMSLFILRQGLMNNESFRLTLDITERLFGEAPLHLKRPQIVELSKLSIEQLTAMMEIERIPIQPALRQKLVDKVGETIITRLCVQLRLVCSAGDSPAMAKVRSHVVRMAG